MNKKRKYKKSVLPQILLIVEGKTEEQYFREYRQENRIRNIKITITSTNNKQDIISIAKQHYNYDVFIFIDYSKDDFDLEDIQQIKKKINRKDNKKRKVLYSKPNFEFWYLSHFLKLEQLKSVISIKKTIKKALPQL